MNPSISRHLVTELRLSWDLFIIVFFTIVIAYSFIIGRNTTLKVIIAAYMAILTADSLGGLFQTYLLPAAPSLQGAPGQEALILLKIFAFILVIVLLTIRGGFYINLAAEQGLFSKIFSNLIFGFLNAGLVVSSLLVYLTGGSFFSGGIDPALTTNLYLESELIRTILDYHELWFSLPALAVVALSFFESSE